MKRRMGLLLLALLLSLALALPVFGEAQLDNVVDAAGLLTTDQQTALMDRARELSSEYDFGIYIIAVQDYSRYSRQSAIEDAFVDIFDQYGLGCGEDRAAASFFISMDGRDYVFDFNGQRADYAFTENGRDLLEERVLPHLRDNDWYAAFNEYLNVCQEYLLAARNGTPVGEVIPGPLDKVIDVVVGALFFCLPGLIAAAVTAVVLVVPMYSSGVKHKADEYIIPGSMRLTRQSDHYLRRTVTRKARPKESSSSGSSSHSYSSGSHSGRSGKF